MQGRTNAPGWFADFGSYQAQLCLLYIESIVFRICFVWIHMINIRYKRQVYQSITLNVAFDDSRRNTGKSFNTIPEVSQDSRQCDYQKILSGIIKLVPNPSVMIPLWWLSVEPGVFHSLA